MAEAARTLLFLCTGNYYRSRYAEALFNAGAARLGLPWRAESRGVAIELGVNNVGPMSAAALARLRARGHLDGQPLRMPLQLAEADLCAAAQVIALKEAEHRPLLEQRFPGWAERVRYWHVHDTDCCGVEEALDEIERQVEALLTHLASDRGWGELQRPR